MAHYARRGITIELSGIELIEEGAKVYAIMYQALVCALGCEEKVIT